MRSKPYARNGQRSELLDATPPHSPEAERGVLGSCLLDSSVCDAVASVLRSGDFHVSANAVIYRHLLAIHGAGQRTDATLLLERLGQAGEVEAVGGPAYLAEVMQAVPYAANALHYARIVRDHAERRRIIHAATDVLRAAYSGNDPAKLPSRLEIALDGIDTASGIDFAPMTLAQLMAKDVTVEYLIDNIIAARQPLLLAGPVSR